MKKVSLVVVLLLGTFSTMFSQENDTISNKNYLRVFLDGASDSENYIKVKLWYIDYVRDVKQSQVHIIINSQPTASGLWRSALASCRFANLASCRGRPSENLTTWNTEMMLWKFTRTQSPPPTPC